MNKQIAYNIPKAILLIISNMMFVFGIIQPSKAQPHFINDSSGFRYLFIKVQKIDGKSLNPAYDSNMAEITKLARDIGKENELIILFNELGADCRNNGNYSKSLSLHHKALKLATEINNQGLIAITLNNIGTVYRRLDDYKIAMDYHVRALKISDSLNDKHSMAIAINSIGNIHFLNGNLEDAERSFTLSLKLEKEVNSQLGIAINLNNIGNVYKAYGDYEKALHYYGESLEFNTLINSDKGIGICLSDFGKVFLEIGEPQNALEHFMRSLRLFQKTNEKHYVSDCHLNIANVYVQLKLYDSAIVHLHDVLALNKSLGAKSQIYEAHKALCLVFKSLGNFRQALYHSENASIYRDSVINENSQRTIANLQTVYETEKNRKVIDLLKNQDDFNKITIRRQRLIFTLALAIILMTALFAYLAYVNKRQSAKVLSRKNAEIEEARIELQKHADDLMLARDKAQQANRAKTEFLANMSHEIRTPLNSILGFAEILKNRPLDKKSEDHVKAIYSSGRSLLTIINDILDISRVESGKLEIVNNPLNFYEFVNEIFTVFNIKATAKGLNLQLHIAEGFPEIIQFDEIRFRQIMYNLISNAVNYTAKGIVSIYIDYQFSSSDQTSMTIKVSDTGEGISDDEKEKIFEKFYRGKNSFSNFSQGTGLGLSITQRLVHLLGGTIQLDSKLGQGSCFILHFEKIHYQVSPSIVQLVDGNNHGKQFNLQGKKVLIADDIKSNRILIIGMLEGTGIEVIEASDGREVVEKAERYLPDLILMDIRMPIYNGHEANKKLKSHPLTAAIPVVAVTASGIETEYESLFQNSFDAYILKPVQISVLFQVLRDLFPTKPMNDA